MFEVNLHILYLISALVFSTGFASEMYMKLYRPINGLIGIGFIL